MNTTTKTKFTVSMAVTLRAEAAQAGDLKMIKRCDQALAGNRRAQGDVLAAVGAS